MTYQPMTNEVRTLLRGLALAYGQENRGGSIVDWDDDSLDLAMLETELTLVQDLHPDAGLSCGPRKIHVAGDNFYDRTPYRYTYRYTQEPRIHVLHFGAYGDTHVLAFGSLEDALEDAAAVLREVAPGSFTDVELPDDYETMSEEEQDEAQGHATADLTYTESGYLASCEWAVTSFGSVEAVLAYAAAC